MGEIDFSSLNDAVREVWPHVVRICDMGRYKALLTFDSVHSAEEALECSGAGIQGILISIMYAVGMNRYGATGEGCG
ncbi:hypothetical protein AHAS_Ahas13G0133100 [Arachis hypogaea]